MKIICFLRTALLWVIVSVFILSSSGLAVTVEPSEQDSIRIKPKQIMPGLPESYRWSGLSYESTQTSSATNHLKPVEMVGESNNVVIDGGIEDTTGYASVRRSNVKAEVELKINKRSTIGVMATKELHDQKDAMAWKESPETDQTATVKYKVDF